ncbi:hypothetical protein [Alicyclobacillus sp.]|uniref:hypothetical protein n=1 Tax=Alicyclobacillus sp. TaxID=61169 RepID=UPI0025BD6DFC|nr:hypothetical protein [Alicyclobacillus sp.]MCL6516840.1 hypothetical protein [Alicyclobacillus sp.]
MWELVDGMAERVRHRVMPRRRNGMNTVTAMVVGASVGIAVWEAVRRSRTGAGGTMGAAAAETAREVMESLED